MRRGWGRRWIENFLFCRWEEEVHYVIEVRLGKLLLQLLVSAGVVLHGELNGCSVGLVKDLGLSYLRASLRAMVDVLLLMLFIDT